MAAPNDADQQVFANGSHVIAPELLIPYCTGLAKTVSNPSMHDRKYSIESQHLLSHGGVDLQSPGEVTAFSGDRYSRLGPEDFFTSEP